MEAVAATDYGVPNFVVHAVDFFVTRGSNSRMRQWPNMSNILLQIVAVVFLSIQELDIFDFWTFDRLIGLGGISA